MSFALFSRAAILAFALVACTPGPRGDTTDTTTGPSPGTEGMSSTDTPTGTGTTTEAPTTTTDGVVTSSGTTEEPGTTTAPDTTTLGPGTTTDTTTGVPVCDLVELTTEEAHELGGEVEDCGVVDPVNNTAEEWQAARDCAVAAAAAQKPFQLVTWLQGFDSSVGRGYTGVAARSFAIDEIHFDSLGSPIAFEQPCESLVAVDGCVVGPGAACLECVAPGASLSLCDIP